MADTYQTGVTYVLFGNLTNPNVSPAQKRRIKAGYRIQGESQFNELTGVAFNKDTGRMEVDHAFDDALAGETVEVIFYKDNDIENGQVTVVTFEEKFEYMIFGAINDNTVPFNDGKYTTNEWIYNKETGEYEWDPNVTSSNDPDLKEGYEYVGKARSDINRHFEKNLSNWLIFKRAIGGSVYPNINTASFMSAKLTPMIENAFIRQKDASQRIIDGKISEGYQLGKFYPIDFNIAGYGRKTSVLSSNAYFFDTTLKIGGKDIKAQCQYTVRDKYNNNVFTIIPKGTFSTGGGHAAYKNAFSFNGKSRAVVVVSIKDDAMMQYVLEYVWMGLEYWKSIQ